MADISLWISFNMLKLNQDKTELIVFSSNHQAKKTQDFHLIVGDSVVNTVHSVRNLGVYLDSSLTMGKQFNAVSRACYYQIRNIGCIRQCITTDTCKTLVNSLVTSHLDYGNALHYGILKLLTARLQGVQNSAARLITRTRKREHITPVLKSLHWLPVVYIPLYKLLMYTYKALNSTAPVYLEELVIHYHPRRSLRSESGCLLCVPKKRTQPMEIAVSASQLPPCGTIYQ